MQKREVIRHFRRRMFVVALVAAGCATSMQMSSEDLNRLTPAQGVVIGSVQVKGGKDLLGRTGWTLQAQRFRGPMSSLMPEGFEYSLNASREGAEEVFITKMEAGDYRFWKLSQHGFSTFTADTNVHFKVQPGKNVYIGRLTVEFPPGVLMVGTRFRTAVDDARESTLETARKKSGLSLGDVITDLMVAVK